MPRINPRLTRIRDIIEEYADAGFEETTFEKYKPRQGYVGVTFRENMFNSTFYVPQEIQFGGLAADLYALNTKREREMSASQLGKAKWLFRDKMGHSPHSTSTVFELVIESLKEAGLVLTPRDQRNLFHE